MKQELVVFEGYDIQKLSIERVLDIPKEKKQTIDLNIDAYRNSEKKYKDRYRITMKLKTYTENTEIYSEINGYFKISEELNIEEKNYFLNVSAPAIIYPYIRALISNITSFDVEKSVVLPVIDFTSLKNDK